MYKVLISFTWIDQNMGTKPKPKPKYKAFGETTIPKPKYKPCRILKEGGIWETLLPTCQIASGHLIMHNPAGCNVFFQWLARTFSWWFIHNWINSYSTFQVLQPLNIEIKDSMSCHNLEMLCSIVFMLWSFWLFPNKLSKLTFTPTHREFDFKTLWINSMDGFERTSKTEYSQFSSSCPKKRQHHKCSEIWEFCRHQLHMRFFGRSSQCINLHSPSSSTRDRRRCWFHVQRNRGPWRAGVKS